MFRTFILLFGIIALSHAPSAFSHGGGHGAIDEEQARAIAVDAAGQFASFDPGLPIGKLPGTWQSIATEASRIHAKGDGYYIVGVENQAEARTLYILMSVAGDIYDANFTGDFPKVK